MVLPCGALLEKHLTVAVQKENGKCPVQPPAILVRREFARHADRLVVFVNENDLVAGDVCVRNVGHGMIVRVRGTFSTDPAIARMC
jgi:hypothetical protein